MDGKYTDDSSQSSGDKIFIKDSEAQLSSFQKLYSRRIIFWLSALENSIKSSIKNNIERFLWKFSLSQNETSFTAVGGWKREDKLSEIWNLESFVDRKKHKTTFGKRKVSESFARKSGEWQMQFADGLRLSFLLKKVSDGRRPEFMSRINSLSFTLWTSYSARSLLTFQPSARV